MFRICYVCSNLANKYAQQKMCVYLFVFSSALGTWWFVSRCYDSLNWKKAEGDIFDGLFLKNPLVYHHLKALINLLAHIK